MPRKCLPSLNLAEYTEGKGGTMGSKMQTNAEHELLAPPLANEKIRSHVLPPLTQSIRKPCMHVMKSGAVAANRF